MDVSPSLRPQDVGFGQLFWSIRDAVVVADAGTGRIVLWNPAAAEIFGYSEREALDLPLDHLVPEPLKAAHRAGLAGYHATGHGALIDGHRPVEVPALRKTGEEIVVDLMLTPVTEATVPGHFVLAILRDATARKRAEEGRQVAEERYRTLVEHLPTATYVATAGAEGISVYISPQIERLTGFTPAEWETPGFYLTRLHPDDRTHVQEATATFDATGNPYHCVYRTIARDGRVIWIQEDVVLVRDAADQPLYTLGMLLDITARKAVEQQLYHQAFHDSLTGLANRALFLESLEQALARAARHDAAVAVLSLDLDRFKVINDSLGHAAGDQLLVAVAARLVGCLRQEDTVARMGGDEFAILLGEPVTARQAVRAAARIIHALEAPFLLGGHEVVTATSIGILTSTPHHTPADVARDVDVALYRAKSKGRGRFEVFDATMNAHALERLELEQDLRLALERGEFAVYYQPKITLATGQLAGLEALVRWVSPTRGLVAPTAFIPLAEETGLIRPLGQWVLEEACRQTRLWHDQAPGAPLVTCVNLSARQFQHPTLVEDVARALQQSGVEPSWIELEITESVVMEDAEITIATLRQFKALGVRLAIDDFGTGYSSLSYLKRFPVDTLKIDRSFVSGMQRESDDASIVHAVISLGHALRLSVVAEGVETAAEGAQLRALGCELGQGYYFAPPLPREQADAFIRAARAAV